ncbi:MAG: alpha-glucuronidase [Spirochaetales bacterium]|nr:alpha-glucuronidase [Spirochaetales bacterium]
MKNEDGYSLWLRYFRVKDNALIEDYRRDLINIKVMKSSPTMEVAKDELIRGLSCLLGREITTCTGIKKGTIILGVKADIEAQHSINLEPEFTTIVGDGYVIIRTIYEGKDIFIISGLSEIGVLYGTFHFLRLIQTHVPLNPLSIKKSPKIQLRILNHWDNLDGTVERGYAGCSLWDWHRLPGLISPRYKDYARANASIGINGAVLNNVNANSLSLTIEYLEKAKVLADVFRPYGIKVYLSVRFSAPMEIGGLKTSDPKDKKVIFWWKSKVSEIYGIIPDFGGFIVKANSEGQPGPQDYGRSQADGANMLAHALKPYGGVVMWRAFVYDFNIKEDRAKQAFNEFIPLDGMFMDNVLIQVKNGPIDFQPREPFHPLFGAMKETPLMMEFQITQEYLGLATNLVYLGPLFKECLDSDTYAEGKGSSVGRIIDGSLYNNKLTGIAGVANIGTDRNWCGHHFAQGNWYVFGRLAWDHTLGAEEIADEWIRMTFSNCRELLNPVSSMMMTSREAAVNYMTPLGLHHIMAHNHHYGPGPWVDQGRPDWTSTYYHQADPSGIGFDRTVTGSNALSQYSLPIQELYANEDTCPENLLLWFHHVSWDKQMKSGRTLWEELCFKYEAGVEAVRKMRQTWDSIKDKVDEERFTHVQASLGIQEQEAIWWKSACLLYFQSFSRLPFPKGYDLPTHTLDYYKKKRHYFVPGIYNPFIKK